MGLANREKRKGERGTGGSEGLLKGEVLAVDLVDGDLLEVHRAAPRIQLKENKN